MRQKLASLKGDYPSDTEADRIASAVRKKASSLSDEDRDMLFRRSMATIYGSACRQIAVRSRH